jgi:predicted alpha/beta hydrolase
VAEHRLDLPVPGSAATIVARRFDAEGAPRGAVLIAGAMGVKQAFYGELARWLAAQGWQAMTFDYRGMGESRPPHARRSLRGFAADLFDWARDMDAALVALASAAPGVPLLVVGHSLGGQLAGMLRHRERMAGLVMLASGSGYWRDNAPPLKRKVHWFWHVMVPIGVALTGYFPGRRLGAVGDLPRGVVLQWRRWCMDPRYHVGAEGETLRQQFASMRCPVVALSISDDEMMTERGTRVLLDCYENAPRELRRITPGDAGAARIGHFGFFRSSFESTLWPRLRDTLATMADARDTIAA